MPMTTPVMTFKQAAEQTPTPAITENGMATYTSSMDAVVDLFYNIGAFRGRPEDVIKYFECAYKQDKVLAVKVALYARDIRGGFGEREVFRQILRWLELHDVEMVEKIVGHIAEFGRWDDLLAFKQPETRFKFAYPVIHKALTIDKNGLCAKWMPRKGQLAVELRNFMELTPKQYRKLLVSLTKVVEQQMCSNQWEQINFSHVPSIAAKNYAKAFGRHTPELYAAYKEQLKTNSGGAKVNASAIYPYEVLRGFRYGDPELAVAQWEALPNYFGAGNARVLPMVDTSDSMTWTSLNKSGLQPADVAISLGLYCATKQQGAFSNMILSFNSVPRLHMLGDSQTLSDKIHQVMSMDVGRSTSIQKALEMVLRVGVNHNVPAEKMPTMILIFSDMEFDCCTDKPSETAVEMMARKYTEAGYTLPKVVFWNLNTRTSQAPAQKDHHGIALVSGFSPSIVKTLLAGGTFTPVSIMLDAVNVPRYNAVFEQSTVPQIDFNEAYKQAMNKVRFP